MSHPRVRLETVGMFLAFLAPALGLSHAMEDARYAVGALAVVGVACVWRQRASGSPALDLCGALLTGVLSWITWRETRLPTGALATCILSLQSYKLLFPRLTAPRKPAPPLAQALFPPGSEREAAVVEAASLVLLGAASAQSLAVNARSAATASGSDSICCADTVAPGATTATRA